MCYVYVIASYLCEENYCFTTTQHRFLPNPSALDFFPFSPIYTQSLGPNWISCFVLDVRKILFHIIIPVWNSYFLLLGQKNTPPMILFCILYCISKLHCTEILAVKSKLGECSGLLVLPFGILLLMFQFRVFLWLPDTQWLSLKQDLEGESWEILSILHEDQSIELLHISFEA